MINTWKEQVDRSTDVLATRHQSPSSIDVAGVIIPISVVRIQPSCPTWASTRVQNYLTKKKKIQLCYKTNDSLVRTDAALGVRVARAPAAAPKIASGTMRILVMRIPDLVEKVDTFRAGKERRTNRVHVGIAPTLFIRIRSSNRGKKKGF
jgi:hypothetical protein